MPASLIHGDATADLKPHGHIGADKGGASRQRADCGPSPVAHEIGAGKGRRRTRLGSKPALEDLEGDEGTRHRFGDLVSRIGGTVRLARQVASEGKGDLRFDP